MTLRCWGFFVYHLEICVASILIYILMKSQNFNQLEERVGDKKYKWNCIHRQQQKNIGGLIGGFP